MAASFPVRQDDQLATLKAVHAWAHAHFACVPDLERWSQDFAPNMDHWETDAELVADLEAIGRVHGDCDAFAKLCWLALRRLGNPSRLAICQAEAGGWHAVCESDGWVLDNRMPTLVSNVEHAEIGYRFHSVSGYEPRQGWTAIVNPSTEA